VTDTSPRRRPRSGSIYEPVPAPRQDGASFANFGPNGRARHAAGGTTVRPSPHHPVQLALPAPAAVAAVARRRAHVVVSNEFGATRRGAVRRHAVLALNSVYLASTSSSASRRMLRHFIVWDPAILQRISSERRRHREPLPDCADRLTDTAARHYNQACDLPSALATLLRAWSTTPATTAMG